MGLAALLMVLLVPAAHAQYFGRNKVQYRTFEFEILKTEHFDIYHYPEEGKAAEIAARMAERWYARLSRFLRKLSSSSSETDLYAQVSISAGTLMTVHCFATSAS